MDKADFEAIGNSYTIGQFIDYGDLNEQAEHQIKEAHKAGCEHVWNTHVVPLQEENMREKARKEDIRRSYDQMTRQIAIIVNEREKLESENKALREENLRLQNRISSLENIAEMDRKTEYQYNQLYKEKEALREEIDRLKAEVLKEKFPEN